MAARVEWPSRGAPRERSDGGGQDASGRSYYFGIYRSADLATWEQISGGALPVDDRKNWGNDWFWSPEVYHNPATDLYFLLYSSRSDANARRWFGFADFEEPCKVGVAVSRSPEGPFYNIANQPIDVAEVLVRKLLAGSSEPGPRDEHSPLYT